MSKEISFEGYYLDVGKGLLRTRSNLYKLAIDEFIFPDKSSKKIGPIASPVDYSVAASNLKLSLLFAAEPAYHLAFLYSNGIGVKTDIPTAILYASIGMELGNIYCRNLIMSRTSIPGIDMTNLLSCPYDLAKVLEDARPYVAAIIANRKKFSVDDPISFTELSGIATFFENANPKQLLKLIDEDYSYEVIISSPDGSSKTTEAKVPEGNGPTFISIAHKGETPVDEAEVGLTGDEGGCGCVIL